MNQPPPNILSHEWGWDNIRRDVFQLVAWGYQRKEKEIRQRSLEEDITGLLRRGIKALSTKLKNDVSLSCQSSLLDIAPTPDLSDITVSAHQRSNGSAIVLYHVFLDCNP